MAGTRRTSWVWIVFTAVIGAMLITAATVVVVRLTAPEPATVSVHAPATLLVDGKAPPPIPVPAQGSFALATSLDGMVANRDATAVRPIGSVAKAMTALVVLAAHPLELNASGPSITMTNTDVQLYRQAVAQGGSNLPVRAGEVFTERNLLLALLLPSADNIAESLALWVSGNRSVFIARLNATAAAMGMHHTHFADPSGLSNRTVSTAADLVQLAKAVIANPALASVVGTATAELPDGTVLKNLDILLSQQDGWLGIKTGWTGAAGGCLLFADQTFYETGQVITVWGAVLGQPPDSDADPAHPELGEAFASAQSAVVAAIATYASVDLAASPPQVSRIGLDEMGLHHAGADRQPCTRFRVCPRRSGASPPPERPFATSAAQLRVHCCGAHRRAERQNVGHLEGDQQFGDRRTFDVVEAVLRLSPVLPGGVGSFRGVVQGCEDFRVVPGEIRCHPQALHAFLRSDHLQFVQPEVRLRGQVALVCGERRPPLLAECMGRQLPGPDCQPGATACGKEPEAKRVAPRLGALLAATVALVRDLRSLHADAAHAPRIT